MSQRGNITIIGVAICCSSLFFSLLVAWSGYYSVVTQKASQVADLVAVAAVKDLQSEVPNPCSVAQDVAHRNEVSLIECTIMGGEVKIKVSHQLHRTFFIPASIIIPRSAIAEAKGSLWLVQDGM